MIRIVAGALKGRKIKVPDAPHLRPTSSKVREAVFDILQARVPIPSARFLDCCAGTGAVGIEALSRGAIFVEFVEADRKLSKLISENLAALGLASRAVVTVGDRPRERNFTIAFVDPPYKLENPALEACAAALAAGGYLIYESGRREHEPLVAAGYERSYHYGKTSLHLYLRS